MHLYVAFGKERYKTFLKKSLPHSLSFSSVLNPSLFSPSVPDASLLINRKSCAEGVKLFMCASAVIALFLLGQGKRQTDVCIGLTKCARVCVHAVVCMHLCMCGLSCFLQHIQPLSLKSFKCLCNDINKYTE